MGYLNVGFAIGTMPKPAPVPRTPDLDAEFPMPSALQQLAVQKGTTVSGSSFLDRLADGAKGILASLTNQGKTPTAPSKGTNYYPTTAPQQSSFLPTGISPLILIGGAAAVYFLVIRKKGRR